MKRPATKTLVLGHPVIAVPLSLAGAALLFAGFQTGSLFPVFIAFAIFAMVRRASEQASAYRAWKTEWDGMAEHPPRRAAKPGRIVGVMLVAALMLVAYVRPQLLAYAAGYAVGWTRHQPWLLAALGLLALGVLVQFVRYFPRRRKPAKPVTVIARPILPVPTLPEAYRALPPYCHALLRGRQ